VPLSLSGLWDSMFSRKYKQVWKRLPRRFLAKITLKVGEPVSAEQADVHNLRQRVVELRGAAQ
jgi:hypothetical protein